MLIYLIYYIIYLIYYIFKDAKNTKISIIQPTVLDWEGVASYLFI